MSNQNLASAVTDVHQEVDELATAYFALKRMPPEAHGRAMQYLYSRLDWDYAREKKAALAVARFIRKLYRNSPTPDRSGEADETRSGSAEGESGLPRKGSSKP